MMRQVENRRLVSLITQINLSNNIQIPEFHKYKMIFAGKLFIARQSPFQTGGWHSANSLLVCVLPHHPSGGAPQNIVDLNTEQIHLKTGKLIFH